MHDSKGRALHTIRYGRMPAAPDTTEFYTHREVHRLLQRLQQDVIMIRRRTGPIPVALLADGAPELWRLFSQHLSHDKLGVAPVKLIDVWHALEYVAAAARLLETKGKVWPGAFRRWKAWLMEEPDGARRVVEALKKAGLRSARGFVSACSPCPRQHCTYACYTCLLALGLR